MCPASSRNDDGWRRTSPASPPDAAGAVEEWICDAIKDRAGSAWAARSNRRLDRLGCMGRSLPLPLVIRLQDASHLLPVEPLPGGGILPEVGVPECRGHRQDGLVMVGVVPMCLARQLPVAAVRCSRFGRDVV